MPLSHAHRTMRHLVLSNAGLPKRPCSLNIPPQGTRPLSPLPAPLPMPQPCSFRLPLPLYPRSRLVDLLYDLESLSPFQSPSFSSWPASSESASSFCHPNSSYFCPFHPTASVFLFLSCLDCCFGLLPGLPQPCSVTAPRHPSPSPPSILPIMAFIRISRKFVPLLPFSKPPMVP